jgi:hypothetical protein
VADSDWNLPLNCGFKVPPAGFEPAVPADVKVC